MSIDYATKKMKAGSSIDMDRLQVDMGKDAVPIVPAENCVQKMQRTS
jgi:hypothetical protein